MPGQLLNGPQVMSKWGEAGGNWSDSYSLVFGQATQTACRQGGPLCCSQHGQLWDSLLLAVRLCTAVWFCCFCFLFPVLIERFPVVLELDSVGKQCLFASQPIWTEPISGP